MTTNIILDHGLPPEPREPERSITSEPQAPMEAGAEITTLGGVGLVGASSCTDDLVIIRQLVQSEFGLQAALISPGSRVTGLLMFKVDADPVETVTEVAS